MLKLYSSLAEWWPLLSDSADYAGEAGVYWRIMSAYARRPIRTLLELGCGGGNNAVHLKRLLADSPGRGAGECRLTLTDVSPQMLGVCRRLNGDCEHCVGDMRTLRLVDEAGAPRMFDAVFAHDAVAYLISEADLRAAMQTAYVHCAPGGVALFVPDCTRETWAPGTDQGGHDSRDGRDRGLRYFEWKFDPDPNDTECLVEMVYLLREGERVTVEHERHRFGLFDAATWVRLMSEVGFRAALALSATEDCETGVCFVGVRQ